MTKCKRCDGGGIENIQFGQSFPCKQCGGSGQIPDSDDLRRAAYEAAQASTVAVMTCANPRCGTPLHPIEHGVFKGIHYCCSCGEAVGMQESEDKKTLWELAEKLARAEHRDATQQEIRSWAERIAAASAAAGEIEQQALTSTTNTGPFVMVKWA